MIGVSPDIQFFTFGDNGVLFHPGVNRLWVLNPVAATIWCLLPEYSGKDEMIVYLAGRFGIDQARVAKDVARCLAYFKGEGLLAGGRPVVPEPGHRLDIDQGGSCWEGPEVLEFEAVIRVPGATVLFRSDNLRLGEDFMAVLRHLQRTGNPGYIDARIDLVRDKKGTAWSVFLDGRLYVSGVADNAVLPHLYSLLYVCATRGLEEYFLLHGAVLVQRDAVLVLPGVARSGKTTLSALLAGLGWQFFSDELVVLDVDSGGVAPFPLPMSIKPGSVGVLRPHYPELGSARLWDRVDGQQVRYLLPPASALPGSPDVQALPSVLVFPKYTPHGGVRLEEIEKVAALQRLAVTGSSNRTLRAADIKAMIDLVERCPAYALVYDDAEEAVRVLSSGVSSL